MHLVSIGWILGKFVCICFSFYAEVGDNGRSFPRIFAVSLMSLVPFMVIYRVRVSLWMSQVINAEGTLVDVIRT